MSLCIYVLFASTWRASAWCARQPAGIPDRHISCDCHECKLCRSAGGACIACLMQHFSCTMMPDHKICCRIACGTHFDASVVNVCLLKYGAQLLLHEAACHSHHLQCKDMPVNLSLFAEEPPQPPPDEWLLDTTSLMDWQRRRGKGCCTDRMPQSRGQICCLTSSWSGAKSDSQLRPERTSCPRE